MSTRRSRGPIWAYPAPGSRRPRFTREQIAEVALRIADREGFEAVSMRRIADDLGAGTMTLYHYVRTKDDLIELLDDAVMAEVVIPEGELPTHWRAAISMIARRSFGAFSRHSWALQGLQSARLGPNAMRHFDQSLAAGATTGLPLADQMALLNIVDDFVFGHAFRTNDQRTRRGRDQGELKAVVEVATRMLAEAHYPHIEAILGGLAPAAAWRKMGALMNDEGRFEQGLTIILDGIALRWKLPAEGAGGGERVAPAVRAPAGRPRSTGRSRRRP